MNLSDSEIKEQIDELFKNTDMIIYNRLEKINHLKDKINNGN